VWLLVGSVEKLTVPPDDTEECTLWLMAP
jgi:hypothetical protein